MGTTSSQLRTGKSRHARLAAALLCLALSLSGCSSGGLKSAFRSDPPAAAAVVRPKGPTPMDAFRTLAPPEGMKFTQLFAEPLGNDSARIDRLEGSVQDLRNDFDTVVPTLVRLASVEKDMKDLVRQLQTMTGEAPPPSMASVPMAQMPPAGAPPVVMMAPASAAPIALAPASTVPAPAPAIVAVPATAAPVVVVQKPVLQPGQFVGKMQALRIGDHGDKTRIVLDMTGRPEYSAGIVNDDRQLVVNIPGINWTIPKSWEANGGDLVANYLYDQGTVSLQLMSKSKILSQGIIPGEGGNGYRLVIDIARINPL